MVVWSLLAAFAALTLLAATGSLQVRRFSRSHVSAKLAVRSYGVYLSRTPDGTWWRLRLRPARCSWSPPMHFGEPPPDSGVRKPRRPLGPGAGADTISPDPRAG